MIENNTLHNLNMWQHLNKHENYASIIGQVVADPTAREVGSTAVELKDRVTR
jgi:hypothetical protein